MEVLVHLGHLGNTTQPNCRELTFTVPSLKGSHRTSITWHLCWLQSPTGTHLLSQHMPVITATKTRGQNIKERSFVFLPFHHIFPWEFIFCTNHIVTIQAVLENGEIEHYDITTLLYQTVLGFSLFKVCIRPPGSFWKLLWASHPHVSQACSSWVMVLGVFKSLGYENHVRRLSTPSIFHGDRPAAPGHHFSPITFWPLWIQIPHDLDSGKVVTGIKAGTVPSQHTVVQALIETKTFFSNCQSRFSKLSQSFSNGRKALQTFPELPQTKWTH